MNMTWDAHLACYAEADSLFQRGVVRPALKSFRNALLLAPGDVDTLWAIGDCYSELGKPRLAEVFYRKARAGAVWRQRGDLLYNMANALLDQGRPAAALRFYQLVPRKAGSFGLARKNAARARALLANKAIDTGAQGRPRLRRSAFLGRRSHLR
jgi:tetratricopeptide (TPR) repeat protein